MACYIFLKSLRRLEEFRKNPHVKVPPKSPSTNFQNLGKFKNPIFNSEIHFSLFSAPPTLRPTRPLAQPAHWHHCPRRSKPSQSAHPARTSVVSSREIRFPFWFAPSELAASPSSLCQPGPSCQLHPPPPVARASPSSMPQVPPDRYHLAFIFPPLIPLLNPPPPSMALKPLMPALNSPATPPWRSPAPYKRRAPPPSFTAPLPASFPLSPHLSSTLTELRHR
jgi:hypothetical protein